MDQIATAEGQVVMQAVNPQQVQVMQMNTGQVIQGANGQQIMVHTVPQNGQIQVAQGTQGLQQIQVVPVSSLQTAQGQVLVQPQQAQIVQTADGQTFIYQPVAIDNTAIQQAQPTGNCLFIIEKVFAFTTKLIEEVRLGLLMWQKQANVCWDLSDIKVFFARNS